jgi:hypothetical protein
LAPVIAVPILSIVYSMTRLALTAAVQPGFSVPDPIGAFVPDALYDTLIGTFVGPLVVTLRDRRTVVERAEW